jgi:16S rRNA (guanine527-N7)-methyltransferase
LPSDPGDLPELDPAFWRVLDDGARAAALDVAADERAAIDGHVRLLLAWNAAINLTALRTPEQIARNHVLDSLITVPALRALVGDARSLLDIGSGAGFPGLPLIAMLRPARAALVDSIGKKARFLGVAARHVQVSLAARAAAVAPEIAVLAGRAEDLAAEPGQRAAWNLVTARAVGTLAEVAELGLPLARSGGHVFAWKLDQGDGALRTELEAARPIIAGCGGSAPRIVRLEAASTVGLEGHCLIAIRKVRPTPNRYPRPRAERIRSR